MKVLGIALAAAFLTACGLKNAKEGEEKREREREREEAAETRREKIFFSGKEVGEREFIGEVEAGDILQVTISGTVQFSEFGEVYGRDFPSTWKEKNCRLDKEPTIRGERRGPICFYYPKKGTCKLRYRNFEGVRTAPMEFPGEFVHFEIGGEVYALPEAEFGFEVPGKGPLYLVALTDEGGGTIRTGFLGFGECQGRGNKGFSHQGSEKFRERENKTLYRYDITIKQL